MSASVGSNNISFKDSGLGPGKTGNSLFEALKAGGFSGASNPGSTNISLGDFYGADFTDGTSAPSTGNPISVSDFRNKTMGSSGGGSGGY